MKLPVGCYEAGELLDAFTEERKPLIEGVLRTAEIANICAGTKAHKSWLALDTALAIATGRPWLDYFPVTRGRVLTLDYELHRETTAHRLRTIAQHRGIARSEYSDRMYFHNLRDGNTIDVKGLRQYLRGCREVPLTVVIVDALYRALPDDYLETDPGKMREVYSILDDCAAETGAAVVVIHHTSKGSQAEKSVTDRGSGSGVLSRVVDAHLTLTPLADGKSAVLEAALRTWPELAPVGLRWDGVCWHADSSLDVRKVKVGKTRGDVAQLARDADAQEKVLTALVGKSLTIRGLTAATGMSTERVGRAVNALIAAGRLQRREEAHGTRFVVLYSLAL